MDQFDRNPTTPGRWFSVRILNGSASEGRPVGREGALELVRPEMAIWSDTSVGGGQVVPILMFFGYYCLYSVFFFVVLLALRQNWNSSRT